MSLRRSIATAEGKRRYVKGLFATIADRYDFITVALSAGNDRRWKSRLLGLAALRPDDRVLDLACGTGDLLFAAARRSRFAVGLDVTFRMLQLARGKAGAPPVTGLIAGDMTTLPFVSGRFTVVTTGYGLRNVPDLPVSLTEIARVLAPGGRLLSLDFNRPESALVRSVYLAYLTIVGSVFGLVLHGDPDTYRYIPESIRTYPGAAKVARLLHEAGFTDVRVIPLLGGLMAIHTATRG